LENIKQLIAVATALNPAEKQYWLDLLPTMNPAQLAQLKGILVTEQKTINDIDRKYDQKLEGVAQKYLSRWDTEKVREVRLKRAKEEEAHQTESHGEAEALLKNW
jgi:wobble nucleotide-excising tRNase